MSADRPQGPPDPPSETELLLGDALGAWRPSSPTGEVLPHPAWADLAAADRKRLFEETLIWRRIEAARDPRGLSGTARAVLGRIGLGP